MMTAQQSVADVSALPRPHAAGDRRDEYVPYGASRKEEAESSRDSAGEQDEAADKPADGEESKKAEAAGATKKSRRELPPHTVAILKGWMLSPEHVKHPYPTDEDKQMLLKKTGINMKQLTNWFTNARKRIWKPMMRREHSRQLQSAMEFDKSRPRDMFPGAAPVAYAEGAYGPRTVSHSFDAGSLGPPRDPQLPYDPYARLHPSAVPGGVARYSPSVVPGAAMYPPRAIRSMSEAPPRSEVDEYINAMHIRKRLHDRDDSGDYEPSDKRMRTSMSPRGLKVLQDWVNARAHTEYPFPNDSERVQLSRETGLDIGQLDAWIKSLHERAIGATSAPSPRHGGNYASPSTVGSGANDGSGSLRSIPSRDNPQFPPPPTATDAGYRTVRRSIPSAGNSLFPPRPTATMRSVPGAGNPQFPPPPSIRREGSESERCNGYYPAGGNNGYPASSAAYPVSEALRSSRSLSISSGQYLHPPPPTPTGQHAPPAAASQGMAGGLPSLSSRNLMNRPVTTPTMGQPRDSRSHTLDMSQFADARRRRMNFQDILASTKESEPSAAMVQSSNSENVYPNHTVTGYPSAGYDAQQEKNGLPTPRVGECQRCGRAAGSCACGEPSAAEAGSTSIV